MEWFMRLAKALDTGLARAQPGKDNKHATAFVEFLQSDEGRRAFEKRTRKAKP